MEKVIYDSFDDFLESDYEFLIDNCKEVDKTFKDSIPCYIIKGKRVIHAHYAGYIGKGGTFRSVYTNSLEDAISKCFNGSEYVRVTESNGSLRIQTTDHDGCNFFRIYKIVNNRLHNINFLKVAI